MLTPKNHNFEFSKINTYEINFLEDIKSRICSIELYTNNQCTQFQAYIFISGCAMAQNPGKCDDVTFLTTIFGISSCRTSKQMTFLES